jgi:adenosylcobinamide-phosphate synthase
VDLGILAPDPLLLAIAVALDFALGDPQYRLHPIRLMGHSVSALERGLRALGWNGYGGGIALGLLLALAWGAAASSGLLAAERVSPVLAMAGHVFIVYSFLAMRDLLDHVWAVESAARSADLERARFATSRFVARDTSALDFAACRRAGIESLSENLTDGYVSPLFWYLLAGLPGLVAFKVFSTLDSMVGNKSERYIRFGWFSARVDDVLNWVPARLTWILIALVALFLPRCSARAALAVGWRQHALVPGPNSGWSEAAMAGAIQRRLVGPIVLQGKLVTDLWLGDRDKPPAGLEVADVPLAAGVTAATGLAAAALCIGALSLGAWAMSAMN